MTWRKYVLDNSYFEMLDHSNVPFFLLATFVFFLIQNQILDKTCLYSRCFLYIFALFFFTLVSENVPNVPNKEITKYIILPEEYITPVTIHSKYFFFFIFEY